MTDQLITLEQIAVEIFELKNPHRLVSCRSSLPEFPVEVGREPGSNGRKLFSRNAVISWSEQYDIHNEMCYFFKNRRKPKAEKDKPVIETVTPTPEDNLFTQFFRGDYLPPIDKFLLSAKKKRARDRQAKSIERVHIVSDWMIV
jgi:hypothetical protein